MWYLVQKITLKINAKISVWKEGELLIKTKSNWEYAEWGPWSWCSASCGFGQHTRSRECTSGNLIDCGLHHPELNITEVEECTFGACCNILLEQNVFY